MIKLSSATVMRTASFTIYERGTIKASDWSGYGRTSPPITFTSGVVAGLSVSAFAVCCHRRLAKRRTDQCSVHSSSPNWPRSSARLLVRISILLAVLSRLQRPCMPVKALRASGQAGDGMLYVTDWAQGSSSQPITQPRTTSRHGLGKSRIGTMH